MQMDMQEMMEAYKKLATPGAPHKMMAGMTGSWNARLKTWMSPEEPPMESMGISEYKMVLDGRFLQQEFRGQMMGSQYNGIGFMGYDNSSGKYESTWMDSMGTAIMLFVGTASADGKTITQNSKYDDPIQGPMEFRTVTRMVDDNTVEFEMYSTGKTGKEEKMMEITYTRK